MLPLQAWANRHITWNLKSSRLCRNLLRVCREVLIIHIKPTYFEVLNARLLKLASVFSRSASWSPSASSRNLKPSSDVMEQGSCFSSESCWLDEDLFFYTTAWVLQQLQRKHSINFALSLKIQVHICHLWEKREPPATRWWRMKAHKVLTKPPVGARTCNFTSQWATQTWLYSPVVNHSHGKEAPWILTLLSYTK